MKRLADISYYFITDPRLSSKGIYSDVEKAIMGGCRIIQYREKSKPEEMMVAEALKIKGLCRGKALFLINDSVSVALAVNADGVHVGQDDTDQKKARELLGDRIIGVTVHNVKEACLAEKHGADYLGVSPVYPTGTKTDAGASCGTEMIREIREKVDIPIVAIGGINKRNTSEVIESGADSVAAISAVVCSDDVEREVREFIDIINESKLSRRRIES